MKTLSLSGVCVGAGGVWVCVCVCVVCRHLRKPAVGYDPVRGVFSQ